MKTILRYVAVVTLPVGYLIWLAILLSNGPSDKDILDTVSASGMVLILTNLALPAGEKSVWGRICLVPSLLVIVSWAWFYFRLSPAGEWPSMLDWIVVVFSFSGGITLCDMAYRKWWPDLPLLLKVFLTTAGIIICGGAVFYLLSAILKGVNWHDVLITNWYLTLLVLYLPIFLGVLFIRSTLEKRKTERKPDAQTPVA
jgi:hypothetical protein